MRRLPDPFAYCRRRGIQVLRLPGGRRWFTANVYGEVVVVVNARLSPARQRAALADALMAHPVFPTAVSRA